MNQAVHQLLQLILQGFTWFIRTMEALWVWSWSQIAAVFRISWENLPGWKIALAAAAVIALAALLVVMLRHALSAFGRIARAFWTMAATVFGALAFVVMAGILSRGLQWVVVSVPDNFWEKLSSL
jgi:hypothetical protein